MCYVYGMNTKPCCSYSEFLKEKKNSGGAGGRTCKKQMMHYCHAQRFSHIFNKTNVALYPFLTLSFNRAQYDKIQSSDLPFSFIMRSLNKMVGTSVTHFYPEAHMTS